MAFFYGFDNDKARQNGSAGDVFLATDTDRLYVWDSSLQWTPALGVTPVLADAGTATAGAASTITDATGGKPAWATNMWAGGVVRILSGTGIGQTARVQSNTGTVITIIGSWATNSDSTSVYRVMAGLSGGVTVGAQEVTRSTSVTLNPADLLGGYIVSVPGAGITLTLPTATNLVNAIPNAQIGQEIIFQIANNSAGANAITIGGSGSNGITARPATLSTIAQNKAAQISIFLTAVSGTPTYTAYLVVSA